jgi:hypothetical protein
MEWTREQREQAAERIVATRRGSHLPAEAWASIADILRYDVGAKKMLTTTSLVLDLQCELTAALDEAQRLREQLAKSDTQMGELAVGGAELLGDAVGALRAVKKELQASGNWVARDYGWPANRERINAILSRYKAATKDACEGCGESIATTTDDGNNALCGKCAETCGTPAPPSGEQAAANVGKQGRQPEFYCGDWESGVMCRCEIQCKGCADRAPVEVQDPKGEV